MSDIKDILKSISGELRKAQNNMFSGKFEESADIVKTLDMLLEDAVGADPGHVQVKTYTNQIAKLKRDLEQRMSRASGGAPKPAAAPAVPSVPRPVAPAMKHAPTAPEPAKAAPTLPAGVNKRIRDMNTLIDRGKPRDAAGLLDEINKQYAGQFDADNPDYVHVKQRLETELKETEQEQQQAAAKKKHAENEREEREALSSEWEKRLKELQPFNIRTSDIQNLLEQQQAYDAARQVYSEFQAVDFPYGKTYGLEQIEKNVSQNIEQFPGFLDQTRLSALNEAMDHIDSRYTDLDRILEGKPAIMSDGSVKQTETFLEKYWPLFPKDTDEHSAIREKFDALIQKNTVNRQERAKLIMMRDDIYQGHDAAAIKQRMEQFILSADNTAGIVRSCVYSPEWKELSQWEDYAGNKRFVTRGEIYGQVIAEVKGNPKLFTVYITKEKKSDGSWSQLAGNVMYIEDIARENV
jgi:hypothetical protein